MFKKNTAVTGLTFGLIDATDGSAITSGTVTVYIVKDGGAQTTTTNSASHLGNGQWEIDLTSTEMNADIVGLLFTHADAVPVQYTIATNVKLVSELNDFDSSSDAVTVGTNNDKTGYSLTQSFPTNFEDLGINASGHISRVTLVDTTTTNTDMRGTDNALLASNYTAPPSTSDIVTAIFAKESDGVSFENIQRLIQAAVAGRTTASGNVVTYYDASDVAIFTATVDSGTKTRTVINIL
jgi:hypothetical protein